MTLISNTSSKKTKLCYNIILTQKINTKQNLSVILSYQCIDSRWSIRFQKWLRLRFLDRSRSLHDGFQWKFTNTQNVSTTSINWMREFSRWARINVYWFTIFLGKYENREENLLSVIKLGIISIKNLIHS